MATKPYELGRLDPHTFEHLANQLVMATLGAGATGFAPGADGGRDGVFEGEAQYPSAVDRWSGTWYIQSKFHSPHLSTNAQKWLQEAVQDEIAAFTNRGTDRVWPDNWIIVTNVDPSATPRRGTHDRIIKAIEAVNPDLAKRTHIWGGQKVLFLLAQNPSIQRYYSGFLTSGELIASMIDHINDNKSSIPEIVQDLVVTQFTEQQYTKLEQAGSTADSRPGIHNLFVDLPYKSNGIKSKEETLVTLARAVSESYLRRPATPSGTRWQEWARRPSRSKIWFLRGGPGQGKSTLTQFICQIQRAALIRAGHTKLPVSMRVEELAEEVCRAALDMGVLPKAGRVPVQVELRLYAHWLGNLASERPSGLITYLSETLTRSIEQTVSPKTLKRAFSEGRWLFVFDGLDEVPSDVKDDVAGAIIKFVDTTLVECSCDALVICTSRPQGYAGQLDALEPAYVDLALLQPDEALRCAMPVLAVDRGANELEAYASILREALTSPSIQEIMTTPLQSHIMAVVVRDGGRPPERRWQLFNNFYQVIKKREANRNLADKELAKLLREGDRLIKNLHNRLGFQLHYKAETSSGALTSIESAELGVIVRDTVIELQDDGIEATVETLMEATTDRLVLVSTPENATSVRFDIRPLQEFFAAEYLYENAPDEGFVERLRVIAGDSHWREVMHFLLSALVENGRKGELAQAVQVLIELDEPAVESDRPLARALCRGGGLAARLTREGVLESDKRVRHLFSAALRPLLASTDARSLMPAPPPPHSKNWLQGLLFTALSEQAQSENIGAASLAILLIDDDTARSKEVVSLIQQNDVGYHEVLLSKVGHYYGRYADEEAPIWLYRYVVLKLMGNEWSSLSQSALNNMFVILEGNKDKSIDSMMFYGLPRETAELFADLFEYESSQSQLEELERLGGLVTIAVGRVDNRFSAERLKEALSGVVPTGLFAVISTLLRASIGDEEALDYAALNYSSLIGDDSKLPSGFTHRFGTHHQTFRMETGANRIKSYLRSDFVGQFKMYTVTPVESGAIVDWDLLINTFPSVILMQFETYYTQRELASLLEWLEKPGNVELVVEKLFGDLSVYAPSIEDVALISESNEKLARQMLEALSSKPYYRRIAATRAVSLNPLLDIIIQFPAVLPQVLDYLTDIFVDGFVIGDDNKNRRLASLPEIIRELLIKGNQKWDCPLCDGLSPTVKGACNIINFAAQQLNPADFSVSVGSDMLQGLPEGKRNIRNAFCMITGNIKHRSEEDMHFVNAALHATRGDFRVRASLEHVLRQWREISAAPVTACADRSIWT